MGFLDTLKNLTRPYDEDEDEYMDDAELVDEPQQEKPRPNPFAGFSAESRSQSATSAPVAAPQSRPARPREGKVVNLAGAGGQMQLVLIKPERFETAAEIADQLRDNHPVLINLETTPKDVVRRLVDFLSGVAYATDGKVKKIAANTYVITPASVELVGDLMDELESSGMYF